MRGRRRRNEDNSKKIKASQSFTMHISNLDKLQRFVYLLAALTFEYVQQMPTVFYVAIQIKPLQVSLAE